jgi:endoglucanase
MDRRTLLAGLTGATIGHSFVAPLSAAARTDWQDWKNRFLAPDGRVIDHLQDNASHSEGQAYGLLLAQAHGDRAAFDAIEAWTRAHLLVRGDALMAWRWRPGRRDDDDLHSATDGDLLRAWALMRAEVFSNWGVARPEVQAIARALGDRCLAPDPRAPTEPVLLPWARAPEPAGPVVFNPSYIMPRALRELGTYAGMVELVRAADHGETLLRELAETGLVPDWTRLTATGFTRAEGFSGHHGYDAIRVALYLSWSGQAAHPALRQKIPVFAGGGETPVVLTRAGRALETSTFAGYRAIARLVTCGPEIATGGDGAPYYPATLGLLASVARREGKTCSA